MRTSSLRLELPVPTAADSRSGLRVGAAARSEGAAGSGGAGDKVAFDAIILNAEVLRLYRAGRYDQAIPLAQRALEINEKTGCSASVRYRKQWDERALTVTGPPAKLEEAVHMAQELIKRNGINGGRRTDDNPKGKGKGGKDKDWQRHRRAAAAWQTAAETAAAEAAANAEAQWHAWRQATLWQWHAWEGQQQQDHQEQQPRVQPMPMQPHHPPTQEQIQQHRQTEKGAG